MNETCIEKHPKEYKKDNGDYLTISVGIKNYY